MSNLLVSGAVDISRFCTEAKDILQFAGWILLFFKIAIPIIIIALGMFDFGKAVVAEKEDEVKKQTKRLLYRAIAGVVIFFIPSLVMWLFGAISTYSSDKESGEFALCETCILSPSKCK